MIDLVFLNLIVGVSSILLTRRIFRFGNLADSLLSFSILFLSQVIFSELILGILGALYIGNLILLNTAMLLAIWLGAKVRKPNLAANDIAPAVESLLGNKIIVLGLSLILSFGLVKILINLVNPPFGWDSLNYHFTFPVEWLKQGNLNNPITVSDDPSPTYYPINGSLWFLWLIIPLKSVFLADLVQVPFFALALLAAYNIARKLGLDRELSAYAALLFMAIPNFFKQLQIAYVDVMVAALFLCCLNFLFLLNRNFSGKNTLFFGLSLGLFLGAKTAALAYSVLLIPPFLWLCLKNIKKSYLAIGVFFAVIILGGFSYLRNFIETGNPLYPLDFKLCGSAVFKGVMDTATYRAHVRPEDYRLSKLLFHEGLGAQTLLFILPSVFLALPLTLIKKKNKVDFNLAYFLLLPLMIYAAFRYVIPLANTRYLYPFLGAGLVIGLYVYNLLNVPRSVINILVALSFLASMSELAKRQELVSSIILTFVVFFLFRPLSKLAKKILSVKPAVFILISIILLGIALAGRLYIRNEYNGYVRMVKYSGFWPEAAQAWRWLNNNTSGNNIAYVGRPVPFPLYGTNFKNNVYYVSVNKTDPAKLHYFKKSKYRWGYDFSELHRNLQEDGNYRSQADFKVWLGNIIGRGSDYLFIYSLHQTKDIEFPIEDSWARAHPERFGPVFSNNTIHIYKLLK